MPADTEPEFPPIVLTFAASDPSGGAGLQADILTLASMGCHPLSVVTAITVQDTLGVEGVQAIDAEWVADQARCLLEDMPVDAFKIGVLGSVENIAAIAEIVSDYPDVPLVLDPVLASGRGDELATEEMTHAMRELLLPQTTILTPNSLEARRLADVDDDDDTSLARVRRAADRDGRANTCSSPARTKHTPQVVNTLYGEERRRAHRHAGRACPAATTARAARSPRRSPRCSPTASTCPRRCARRRTTRGTRCKKAYRPGMGQFLPDRLFWAREESDAPAGDDADAAARRRCAAARH